MDQATLHLGEECLQRENSMSQGPEAWTEKVSGACNPQCSELDGLERVGHFRDCVINILLYHTC